MGFPLTSRSMTLVRTAVRSNSLGISRHFLCFGGNNS